MKLLQILSLSFGLFVSPLVEAQNESWWMKRDRMKVQCEVESETYPWIKSVEVSGHTVSVVMADETIHWVTRERQIAKAKVWDGDFIQLLVDLKPSRFGDYHVGTLIFKGPTEELLSMWCYPQK